VPVRNDVLTRCTAIIAARATEASSATSESFTRPAPTSASVIVNTSVSHDAARTRCPRGNLRIAHTSRTRTKMP
jgi:hypothetical protein